MANVTANFHAETVTELYTTTGQFVNVIEPDVEADHTIVLPMDLNNLFQQLPLSRVPIDDTVPCQLYRLQHGALCKATKVDKRASYPEAKMSDWDDKFQDVAAVLTYQPVRGDGWTVCIDDSGNLVRLADADAATIEVDKKEFIDEQVTRLLVRHTDNQVLDLDSTSWTQENKDIKTSVKQVTPGVYECEREGEFVKLKFNSESGVFAYTSIEILGSFPSTDASALPVDTGTLSMQYPSPNFIQEVKKLGVNNTPEEGEVNFDTDLAVYAKFENNARVGNAFRISDGINEIDIVDGASGSISAVVTKRSCDQYGSDSDGAVSFGDVYLESYTLEEHHRTFYVTQESPWQAEMNQYNRILVTTDAECGFNTPAERKNAAYTKYSHPLLEHMGSESLLETGLVLVDSTPETDRPYCMPIHLGDYLYFSSKQLSSRPIYDSRRFLDYCAMAPTNGSSTTSTDITVDFPAPALTNSWQLPEDRAALERGLDELKYGHEANIRIKQYAGSKFQWGKTRHSEASEDKEADPTFTTKVTAAIKDLFKVDDNEEIRVRFNPDKVADYVSSEAINKISCGVFTGVQMREILDACIQFGRINQKSTIDGAGSPDKHEGFRLHLNKADKIGVTVRLFGSTPETEQGITVRIWLEQLPVPESPAIPGPNNNEVNNMTYDDSDWQAFNTSSDATTRDDVYTALKMIQGATDSDKEGGQDILYTNAKVHGGLSELSARRAAENAARGDISS
jgi:hypothetical protein